MSSELRELYQSVILDHNRKPRNARVPEGANRRADGDNPLCGDKISVYVRFEDGVVADVGFVGEGCAISTASASLMTEAVKGRSAEEVERMFEHFHALVTSNPGSEPAVGDLGKLRVFAGVREFPMRVKCATLGWHTLRAALEGSHVTVSTE
jgi:nitrogen fixation NifU-like protein